MHETGQGRVKGHGRGSDRGKNTAVAGQKGRGRAEGRAMLGRYRARAVAWQGAFGGPLLLLLFFCFLSLLKRAPLVLTKKRSGITYVTYMVVTPLMSPVLTLTRHSEQPFLMESVLTVQYNTIQYNTIWSVGICLYSRYITAW